MKPGIYVIGHGVHACKIFGKIAARVAPKNSKTCFVVRHQYNADFRPLAQILAAFEIEDVNECAHAYTGKKFQIYAQGILQVRETTKTATFEMVFVIRLQLKWHNHNGNRFGA